MVCSASVSPASLRPQQTQREILHTRDAIKREAHQRYDPLVRKASEQRPNQLTSVLQITQMFLQVYIGRTIPYYVHRLVDSKGDPLHDHHLVAVASCVDHGEWQDCPPAYHSALYTCHAGT